MSFIQKFKNNSFIKSVAVLMTGTVLAQALTYLITPILTRIYSTEEMGDLGLYLRLVGFISAIATARYELTLPLPKRNNHAFLLYKLSIKISFYVFFGIGLISAIYFCSKSFNNQEFIFVLLCFISSFFIVFINTGTNWAIRMKEFRRISNSRISNSVFSNSFRWFFGIMQFGSIGHILATLIGYIVSSVSFLREFFKLRITYKKNNSKAKTFLLAKEYKEFPMINLPHVLVDLGRDLLVASLIILFFSKSIFGSYSHSYAILRIPLVVIGASIGQVLFGRCSELINNNESIYKTLKKTILWLLLISVIPFAVVFIFGEPLFSFVFSEKWAESGRYSEIMSLWFLGNFIASTISTIPLILGKQKEFFYLGLFSSLLQIVGFGVMPFYLGNSNESFIQILWIVSISQVICITIIIFVILKFSRSQSQRNFLF